MEHRTLFRIEKPAFRMGYDTPVMLTGSCFANEIGDKLAEGKMPVLVNPCGTVYNPASIESTLRLVMQRRSLAQDDLYSYGGKYLSFLHYTDFSSENPDKTLDMINRTTEVANGFMKSARFLFITFGTARVYRFLKTGEIVSNCHKLPADLFSQELLKVDYIAEKWLALMDDLHSFNPGLRVLFTVSPVRHWKDGAHANQVSKSVLFLAIEQLLNHPSSGGYFPAYELLFDDLRDYRYYGEDMLHPSKSAVDYIWDAFSDCYLDSQTINTWKEVSNITRAMKHRITGNDSRAEKEFAGNILAKISLLSAKYPYIGFSSEESFFKSLIGK